MRDNVGLLDDKELREAVDDLLSSAATPANTLMNRLLILGWKPAGEAHISLLGIMLIIHHFNVSRDEGDNIEDSLSNAYIASMDHPTIQKYMAKTTADAIDRGVGVQ